MAEQDGKTPEGDGRPGQDGEGASREPTLNDRLLDLFVYVPAGIASSVIDDLPTLAERGRRTLGTRVSSARAVGEFVVKAGGDELRSRTVRRRHRPGAGTSPPAGPAAGAPAPAPGGAAPSAAAPGPSGLAPAGVGQTVRTSPGPRVANGNVPAAASLSIPGFDSLSASQVVQRLDGLDRAELVSVRAYESANRGRRTILSRVDQLLDERS